jgi:hypothetical protein
MWMTARMGYGDGSFMSHASVSVSNVDSPGATWLQKVTLCALVSRLAAAPAPPHLSGAWHSAVLRGL